jgi:hypothetical protein
MLDNTVFDIVTSTGTINWAHRDPETGNTLLHHALVFLKPRPTSSRFEVTQSNFTLDSLVISRLIGFGVDINARNHAEATPAHLCRSLATLMGLVDYGADVTARAVEGSTILHTLFVHYGPGGRQYWNSEEHQQLDRLLRLCRDKGVSMSTKNADGASVASVIVDIFFNGPSQGLKLERLQLPEEEIREIVIAALELKLPKKVLKSWMEKDVFDQDLFLNDVYGKAGDHVK